MIVYLSDYLVIFRPFMPFVATFLMWSKQEVRAFLLGVKPIIYFEKHCATFLPHPCWASRVRFAVSFDPMFQITSHILILPYSH